jgi:hypothetical protein
LHACHSTSLKWYKLDDVGTLASNGRRENSAPALPLAGASFYSHKEPDRYAESLQGCALSLNQAVRGQGQPHRQANFTLC